MPTAVVVGSDATALHVASQLYGRGFDVTVLEATQNVGGQWVQRLLAEKAERAYTAAADGVFLDFPLVSSQARQLSTRLNGASEPLASDKSTAALDASSPPGRVSSKTEWTELPSTTACLTSDQQLLRHLAEYSRAAGLHRNLRLGCTLRRAKWQAMNGCWRLELKQDPNSVQQQQKQRAQLSADLLVVSKMAVAAEKLPHVPGTELYCGTVLTANDQLKGPGGQVMLRAQLRGRNVLVVGAAGAATSEWAEACRRHVGAAGTVVLVEVDESKLMRTATEFDDLEGRSFRHDSTFSRMFGSCFGNSGGCGGASRACSPDASRSNRSTRSAARQDSFSAAEPPEVDPLAAEAPRTPRGQGGVTLLGGEPFAGTITVDEVEGDGDTEGVELETSVHAVKGLAAAAASEDGGKGVAVAVAAAAVATGAASEAGKEPGGGGAGAAQQERQQQQQRTGTNGERLSAGRSSLRVLRGVTALLNGHYATLSTGEEVPAEVVLLVPLGGTEVSLAFLDAGAPMRASHAGGGGGASSSFNGSFRREMTGASMNGSVTASVALQEPLSRQLDELYRDMVSSAPAAPNLAFVGLGTEAGQHDARAAALQAAWLLATWATPGQGKGGAGGGDGERGGAGEADLGWASPSLDVAFLRQASPVEVAADRTLRGKWRSEAARKARQEVYLDRYLAQLMKDLGVAPQAPAKCGCLGGGRNRPKAASEPLSRQAVIKLLRLKRLAPARRSLDEERHSLHPSPRASPHSSVMRPRGFSCNGGGAFAGAYGAAVDGGDRPSMPGSRDASIRHSGSAAALLRARLAAGGSGANLGLGFASGGGGGGSFDVPLRSDGSCSAALGLGPLGAAAQQASPATIMVSRGSATSMSRAALGNTLLAHEQQLYRVAEHPSEYPVTAPSNANDTGDVDGRGGCADSDPAAGLSCPSSPGLPQALAAGMYSTGSTSGSGTRGRLIQGSAGGSFITSGGPGAGVGVGGGSGGAGCGSSSPSSVGGGGGVGAGVSGGEDAGTQQQRLRAQLLTRHRSTSRLAGVSNASSAAPAVSTSFIGLSFGRRPAAVSTSQVSFDMGAVSSVMNERRSQSGRPTSSRRQPQVQSTSSNIYTGGGGGSSQAVLSRVNSAARLQLLLAAANSASRRRQASGVVQSLPPESPDAYGISGGGGGLGPDGSSVHGGGLHKAHSEALQSLRIGPDGAAYGTRYGSSCAALKSGGQGVSAGPLGRSVMELARAARGSSAGGGGAGALLGSVTDVVQTDDLARLVRTDSASVGEGRPARPTYHHNSCQPTRPSMYGKAVRQGDDDEVDDDGGAGAVMSPTEVFVGAPPGGAWTCGPGEQDVEEQLELEAVPEPGPEADADARDGPGNRSGRARRVRRRSVTLPDLRLSGPGVEGAGGYPGRPYGPSNQGMKPDDGDGEVVGPGAGA